MAPAKAPVTAADGDSILSLVDINYILVNKFVVLLGVLLFFTAVIIIGRIRHKPPSAHHFGAIKLSVFGLLLLYVETTLGGYPNYRLILERLGSVIVLLALARLAVYLLVDITIALRRHDDVPMLLRDAIRLAVYLLTGIISLHMVFNVDLTAVITTTTVLTAAIAFAMQTTLSNALHGFTVQIDPLLNRGTWITITDHDLYGEIVNVGFRYITLRTQDNSQILVPNNLVVQSIINAHGSSQQPANERAALFLNINLPYELPPEQARQLLLDVLDSEQLVLKEPPPMVRLQNLDESTIVYLLRFWVADPQQKGIVFDLLQTKAWYAVRRAGWNFSFPRRQMVEKPKTEPFTFSRANLLQGLHQNKLFNILKKEEVQQLADNAQPCVYAPGETVVKQGDQGSSLFLVLSGQLETLVDGSQITTLQSGKMFGEMSLLTGAPRRATVKALTEAVLAEIPKKALADLLDSNEKLMEHLGEIIEQYQEAARIKTTQDQENTKQTKPTQHTDYLNLIKSFFGRS